MLGSSAVPVGSHRRADGSGGKRRCPLRTGLPHAPSTSLRWAQKPGPLSAIVAGRPLQANRIFFTLPFIRSGEPASVRQHNGVECGANPHRRHFTSVPAPANRGRRTRKQVALRLWFHLGFSVRALLSRYPYNGYNGMGRSENSAHSILHAWRAISCQLLSRPVAFRCSLRTLSLRFLHCCAWSFVGIRPI